jgi:GTP pyrophosphokinase
VPLSHKLGTGDQVEILTSKIQTPQYEWLQMVKTARAKTAIKSVFKEQRRTEIAKGQTMLEEKLKELNYRPNASVFRKMFEEFEVSSKEELYLKLGKKLVNLDNLKKILKKRSKNKQVKFWNLQFFNRKEEIDEEPEQQDNSKPFLLKEDRDQVDYQLAECCEPIPGDDVIGYMSPELTDIIIHKSNCPEALRLLSSHAERIVQANWTTHKVMAHLARIKLQGIDRLGMANELTEKITTQLRVNIRSMTIESRDGIFEGHFDLYVHNTEDLNNLILSLTKIKGVDTVQRVGKSEES